MTDQALRLRLRVATKILLLCGVLLFGYVLLSMFFSSGPSTTQYTAFKVDIQDLVQGQSKTLLWQERPIIVYHRSDAEQAQLRQLNDSLADPNSKRSIQPDWATGPDRSRDPAWFVAIAVGSDMGCPIELLKASDALFKGEPWLGGFVDTCRKSRYDLAGRVYDEQQAQKNLIVPDYRIEPGTLILGAQ